jgi:hypothetical protein
MNETVGFCLSKLITAQTDIKSKHVYHKYNPKQTNYHLSNTTDNAVKCRTRSARQIQK